MRMLWPPARTDDTKRHREIEAGAFFADVGRSEIDRDVRGGDVVTAVAECGADTVAAFAHGRVGQADGVELIFGGLDAGYVDFDFDDVGIDAIDGGAEGLYRAWFERCQLAEVRPVTRGRTPSSA